MSELKLVSLMKFIAEITISIIINFVKVVRNKELRKAFFTFQLIIHLHSVSRLPILKTSRRILRPSRHTKKYL